MANSTRVAGQIAKYADLTRHLGFFLPAIGGFHVLVVVIRGYCAVQPPSTGKVTPLMYGANPDSRKAMVAPISSGRPMRPEGV